MADDKKNIPDAGKADDPPKPGNTEPVKTDPPVQEPPPPAKTEASVVEGTTEAPIPSAAEKPSDGKTVPGPAPEQPALAKENTPQPDKDEKQTTIPGMGDPAPAGKVVDFTAVRDGAAKGKPPEKDAASDKEKQADKAKDAAKPHRGRPAKADKAAPDRAKPQPRDKMSQSKPPAGKGTPIKEEARLRRSRSSRPPPGMLTVV